MGQYYKVVNVDKKEVLEPHDFNEGMKLMEHAYHGNSLVNAFFRLMETDWDGDRVVWAGDYGEGEFDVYNETDVPPSDLEFLKTPLKEDLELDDEVEYSFEELVEERWGDYVFVNYDKKEYVELYTEEGREFGLLLSNPVLLLANSTEGGGSYHRDNDEEVGLWLGDHVGLELREQAIEKGFSKIEVVF